MPEKSIREMSEREKKLYSLAARVFNATLMGAIVLGLISILVGVGIYSYTLFDQYVDESFNLARSTAMIADELVDTKALSDEIMTIYRSLSPEERAKTGTTEYRALYSGISANPDYQQIIKMLRNFTEGSNANDLYFGVYDRETSALVYVADPDTRPGHICYPGDWEELEDKELEKFLNWDGKGRLFDISDTEKYGLLCTSGVPVYSNTGELAGFILADVSLDDVVAGMRNFILTYIAVLMVVVNILGYFMSRHMEKTLVDPINEISEAAQNYADARKRGENSHFFSDLNIRTGDEVENLSLIMADMEKELSEYETNLTKITAERERFGTELRVATRIQHSMLPHQFPPFPDRTEFDLYAYMTPAKEIGGDFYDFFFIDDDHLCLVIADVSGKGIPAALFMMASKIIITNNAKSRNQTPADILRHTNMAVCQNNQEEMFVTVWFGILEISTGKLTASNAGHEYPILLNENNEFEILKDKHGFVIGGLPGARYQNYEIQLKPGAKLFIYTDGVTEATDKENQMFGIERLVDTLNRDTNAKPQQLIDNVRSSVREFVADAEQFDDVTMLCIQYKERDI